MIFFDIDDTLFDYQTSQDLAAAEFARVNADRLVVSPNHFVQHWNAVTQKHMGRYLSGEISFQSQRRERIKASLDGVSDDKEADSLFEIYHGYYQTSWKLFPDCIEALESVKSRRLGIISNGAPNHQKRKLKRLGIGHFFECVVTPADAGAAKPSHLIFDYTASMADLPPSECWYVGDDYQKDYLAAKEQGWNSVWLNRHSQRKPSNAECRTLIEFVSILERQM